MAIRLIEEYPNRVGAPTADYPHGVPRNKSTPTATDGTPFEQSWFRDQEGFFQGLMETAGITPSGQPDTVLNSDYLDALNRVTNGVIEVDMGGAADVSISTYQGRVAALKLTGALAADVDLIVPDTERMYWIIDETTGDFSVTVKTAAGTGVKLFGESSAVRSDGTNVVPFVNGLDRRVIYVETLADLQALPVSELAGGQLASITTTGRAGDFTWLAGNQSTNVTNDPQEGIFVAPAGDATGASGVWARSYSNTFQAKWFGATGDGVTDDTAAIQAAMDLAVIEMGTDARATLTVGEDYKISSITIPSNFTFDIRGATIRSEVASSSILLNSRSVIIGHNAKVFVITTKTTGAAFAAEDNSTVTSQAKILGYPTIQDLEALKTENSRAVEMDSFYQGTFELYIVSFNNALRRSLSAVQCYYNHFSLSVTNCSTGILNTQPLFNGNTFHCHRMNCDNRGVQLQAGVANTFYITYVEGVSIDGFGLAGTRATTIIGGAIEGGSGATGAGVSIGSGASGTTILGTTFGRGFSDSTKRINASSSCTKTTYIGNDTSAILARDGAISSVAMERSDTAGNGDTTPSVARVAQKGILVLHNSSPTTITNLDDEYDWQEVVLLPTNGNTTIQHAATGGIRLQGGADVTLAAYQAIRLIKFPASIGTVNWVELSNA